jgi:hypothetical protein
MIRDAERGPQPEGDVPVGWSSDTFRYSLGAGETIAHRVSRPKA